jgi:hypothetical protein
MGSWGFLGVKRLLRTTGVNILPQILGYRWATPTILT